MPLRNGATIPRFDAASFSSRLPATNTKTLAASTGITGSKPGNRTSFGLRYEFGDVPSRLLIGTMWPLVAALGEEFAWRGTLLPLLRERDHQRQPSVHGGPPEQSPPELSVSAKQSRAAWARLIKKVYDADLSGDSRAQPCESPLICSRCHRPMKVIAVITDPWSGRCTDPAQVLKILMHLVKTKRPPPGLDPTCLH